ncbi:MAG TPA: hypothetical protein VF913_07025 [Xanthobacteraceae bacterium]
MARRPSIAKRLAELTDAVKNRQQLVSGLDADLAMELAYDTFKLNPERRSDQRTLLWTLAEETAEEAAFTQFGLDRNDASHHRLLTKLLALVVFPQKKGGRKKSWTDERYCRLLSDVNQTCDQYQCNDSEACRLLIEKSLFDGRYKGMKLGTLRRCLQNAKNPKHNPMLDTMANNRRPHRRRIRRKAGRGQRIGRGPKLKPPTKAEVKELELQAERARHKRIERCIALIESSWRRPIH